MCTKTTGQCPRGGRPALSALRRLSDAVDSNRTPIGVRAEAHRRLGALAASWQEVQPLTEVRDRAQTLLAKHDLRAGDALQLSAAIAAVNWNGAMDFVCLDDRLNDAARSEGFRIVRPR